MSKAIEMSKDRGEEYGDFMTQFKVAQQLKTVLRQGRIQETQSVSKEALDMICTKMSRIICGNQYSEDSWRDIAGYATLIADQLEKDQESL